MTQQQILSALKLNSKSQSHKAYAAKLAGICGLIASLKKLPGYGFELSEPVLATDTIKAMPQIIAPAKPGYSATSFEYDRYKERLAAQESAKSILGNFEYLQNITVKHASGVYTLQVPTANAFYYYVTALIGATVAQEQAQDTREPVYKAILPAGVIADMQTALTCTSKDKSDLRPAFKGVCLDLQKQSVQVCSTDGGRLYIAAERNCDTTGEAVKYIIPNESVKAIAALKRTDKDQPFEFYVYADNSFALCGVEGNLINERFPDYKAVVPLDNPYKVTFDRADFIRHLAINQQAANKVSKQVKITFNGAVHILCEDKDYGLESTSTMPHISSNIDNPVMMAFNGQLLSEIMKMHKSKMISMQISTPTRSAIISEPGTDAITLLMPQMPY